METILISVLEEIPITGNETSYEPLMLFTTSIELFESMLEITPYVAVSCCSKISPFRNPLVSLTVRFAVLNNGSTISPYCANCVNG